MMTQAKVKLEAAQLGEAQGTLFICRKRYRKDRQPCGHLGLK